MRTMALAGIVSLGSLMLATPALAAPVDDFLARLNQWLAPVGASVEVLPSIRKIKDAGRPVQLVLKSPSGTVPLGRQVTFSPIETWDGDVLFAETITISGFDHTNAGTQAEADTVTLSYVTLPPPGTDNPFLLAQILGGLDIENLRITSDGDSLAIDRLGYAMGVDPEYGSPDPTAIALELNVEGLLINERLYNTIDMRRIPFGKEYFIGQKLDATLPLHWDLAGGLVTISDANVTVPTLGTYSVALQIGGFTLPLLTEMAQLGMGAATGGGAPDPAQQQALGIKLLSQTSFHAASASVLDTGTVTATLEAIARNTGRSGEDALALIADFIDDNLDALNIPEARIEELARGVLGFAQEGGTLGIDAFPDAPSSLIELVALSPTPGAILDKIAFEVVHIPSEDGVAGGAASQSTTDAGWANTPTDPFASPATASEFLDRLAVYAGLAGGRLSVTYANSDPQGGKIENFTLTPPSGTPYALGAVQMQPVVRHPGDVLQGKLRVENFARTEMGAAVTADSVEIGALLPQPGSDIPPLLAAQGLNSLLIRNLIVDSGARLAIDEVAVYVDGTPVAAQDPAVLKFLVELRGLDLTDELASSFGDTPLLLFSGRKLKVGFGVQWSLATGEISLNSLNLSGPDFGQITLYGVLTGFTKELFHEALAVAPKGQVIEDQAAAQAFGIKLLSQLALKIAFIELTDDGFMDDAMEVVAANTGVPADRARQIVVDQYAGFAEQFASTAIAGTARTALEAFADEGGTITVYAIPTQPLNLMVAAGLSGSPKALLEQLGLSVKHEP